MKTDYWDFQEACNQLRAEGTAIDAHSICNLITNTPAWAMMDYPYGVVAAWLDRHPQDANSIYEAVYGGSHPNCTSEYCPCRILEQPLADAAYEANVPNVERERGLTTKEARAALLMG